MADEIQPPRRPRVDPVTDVILDQARARGHEGRTIGAGLGGAAGGIAGSFVGVVFAVAGAAVGALVGGLIGDRADRSGRDAE